MVRIAPLHAGVLIAVAATAASRAVAQQPVPPQPPARICQPVSPVKCYPPVPSDSAAGRQPTGDQPWFEFMVDTPVSEAPDTKRPTFPPELKAAGVGGQVLAQFVVDTNGRVEPNTFRVLKSDHDALSGAVRAALPDMRFTAAIARGRKVRQLVQQPFVFDVKRDGAAQGGAVGTARSTGVAGAAERGMAGRTSRVAGPVPAGTVPGWSITRRTTVDSGAGTRPFTTTQTLVSNGRVVRMDAERPAAYSLIDAEAGTMISVIGTMAIETSGSVGTGALHDAMQGMSATSGAAARSDVRPGELLLGLRTTVRRVTSRSTITREANGLVCSRPQAMDTQTWTTDDPTFLRVVRNVNGVMSRGLGAVLPESLTARAADASWPLRTVVMESWSRGTITRTTEVLAYREGDFSAALFAVPEGYPITSSAALTAARGRTAATPPADSLLKVYMERAFEQMFDTTDAAGSQRATCVKKP